MEDLILTIDKVKFVGKWVEYWFTDGTIYHDNSMPYHGSSKSYMLWELIDKVNLYDEVISNGLHGRKIRWTYIGSNYEPVELYPLVGFVI